MGGAAASKPRGGTLPPEPVPTTIADPQESPPQLQKQQAETAVSSTKKADGEASASQVVGGGWTRPKGPSPDDDKVLEEWKLKGRLHVFQGVWCAVPYKVFVSVDEGTAANTCTRERAQKILDEVAADAEAVFSHFIDNSEVSKINRLGAGDLHVPSAPMKCVLTMVARIHRMTRGAFDPAVYPLAKLFKKHPAACAAAQDVAAYSNWPQFELTEAGLRKKHANAELDLCGLAKGWAIDEMVRRLQEAGFASCFVDWGGDIKVTGTHPAGRDWTAAIVEPPDLASGEITGRHLAHISLRDGQSIATSGDYCQTLAPGVSHVLNPKAGAPITITGETCASVSVVMTSCMLADALATAAMACGDVKAARKLLDGFRGAALQDPVGDYLLYSRLGPRVVRLCQPGTELPEHREDRLSRHEPAHVVIVGGGLAGVSAAIEACKARAKVTLLEKEPDLGGNSAKATSGINACGTRVQRSAGIEDDGRYFERDTHVSAKGGKSDTGCVSMLSHQSSEAIHWLIDEMGIPLTTLSQLGGHSKKRTHRVPPRSDGTPVPVGYTIMQHARAAAASIDGLEVRTGCNMKRLLRKDGDTNLPVEVTGVEYEDSEGALHEMLCDAVVITTGGFGFDHSDGSLLQQHRPDLLGVPTTNGSFANGDGIRFGEAIGASLIDMDKVQLHPTAFIDPNDPGNHTKYLGPEALRGSGGILLDQQGRRFVNELDLRSVVSQKILDHCDPYKMPDGTTYRPWSWCVLNDEAQEKFGRPMLNFYKDQVGLFEAVEGTKGLAELLGCDEQNIIQTLGDYASAMDQRFCAKTGKVVFPSRVSQTDSNFVVARITPCIHYCMGGLEISSCAEVMRVSRAGAMGRRSKVKRLFSAGECTGGVHGGNRLGGNSLLECVVFGRIAGERAATIKQKEKMLLNKGDWVPVQLREMRSTDVKYGHNTAVYRFNLHSSLQHTGLEIGQFVAIKSTLDGDTLTGYYSPVSRPDDEGIIDILCRTDDKGGPIVQLLMSLQPGSSCLLKGMGGVKLVRQPEAWTHDGRTIRRISLLCGGTGLAPAVQIARAYIHWVNSSACPGDISGGVRLIYAAETAGDLAFIAAFDKLKELHPKLIDYYLVLNNPPAGWTMGVGFVDQDNIRQKLWFPPTDDHMLVMCGPPIFENIMCRNLAQLGYPREQYYSFAADPDAIA